MILLDTNVFSEPMRPVPDVVFDAWYDAQPASSLFISTITIAEIDYGIELLPEGSRKREFVQQAQLMLSFFEDRILDFGELAAYRYGAVVVDRRRAGRPTSTLDAQIASIALATGLILATRNTKDFDGIDGLKLIDPWQV